MEGEINLEMLTVQWPADDWWTEAVTGCVGHRFEAPTLLTARIQMIISEKTKVDSISKSFHFQCGTDQGQTSDGNENNFYGVYDENLSKK